MAGNKRRIAIVALIVGMALFAIVYGLAFPSGALAWDNCPKGLVNDPFPGACGRYVDTNDDSICDLSQSKPSDSTITTAAPKSTTTTTLTVTTATSGEPPSGDCPLGPCVGCGACVSIGSIVSVSATGEAGGTGPAVLLAASATSATTSTTTPVGGGGGSSLFTHYKVSPIALGFFLIYAVSFVLYKSKRIRVATHRKIWNALLLSTFLITGVFGLILTIQLDYELPFTMPINLLFWHVEAGVVMTLISLFHVGWHLNYYRNLLRSSRKKVRAARAAERSPVFGDLRVGKTPADRRPPVRGGRGARPASQEPWQDAC